MFAVIVIVFGVLFMMALPYATRARVSNNATPAHYSFLAHWVENYTCLLKFKRWQYMHRDPHDVELPLHLRVFAAFYSFCSLISPLSHEIVDVYDFKGRLVQTVLVNAYAWHFAIPKWLGGTTVWPLYLRWKMLRATAAAHQAGIMLQGLGALTKDHQLTDDGMYYKKELGNKRPKLTHGDTLTAMTVFHQTMQLLKHMNAGAVFLTGSTSKIGRALAVRLAQEGVIVYMYTVGRGSKERFEEVQKEAGSVGGFLRHSTDFSDLQLCRICVTGKGKDSKALLTNARIGTAFLNFAVPDPFQPGDLEGRQLYHYDGALLDYSEIPNKLTFAMRLRQGRYTYACHAWFLTAAVFGLIDDDELGPVDVKKMDLFWDAARRAGFKLPEPTSFLYPAALPQMEGEVPRHITPRPVVRGARRPKQAA